MKIAIPVDEKDLKSNVCVSFGRAPYFLIYNVESKEGKFIDNIAATSTGGAGILAAQIIVDNKADVLLTPRLGENAANIIQAADIEIFKTSSASIEENIEAFVSKDLTLLKEIHKGFHGGGGN